MYRGDGPRNRKKLKKKKSTTRKKDKEGQGRLNAETELTVDKETNERESAARAKGGSLTLRSLHAASLVSLQCLPGCLSVSSASRFSWFFFSFSLILSLCLWKWPLLDDDTLQNNKTIEHKSFLNLFRVPPASLPFSSTCFFLVLSTRPIRLNACHFSWLCFV